MRKLLPEPANYPFFYGWMIVGTAIMVNFSHAIMVNPVMGVFLKPLTEEFSLSRGGFAALLAIGSVFGALIGPFVGRIVDRYGGKGVVIYGSLAASLLMIIMALTQNIFQFSIVYILCRAAIIGSGGIAVTTAVSNWFILMRGRTVSLTFVGMRTGQAILPIIALFFIETQGWRASWAALSILVSVLAVIPAALFLERRPEDVGLYPDGRPPEKPDSNCPSSILATSNRPLVKGDFPWTARQAMHTKSFWILCLVGVQLLLASTSVNLHGFSYLTELGLSTAMAQGTISTVSLVAACSAVLWGFLSERFTVRWCLVIVLWGEGLGIFMITRVTGVPSAIVFAIIYGFFLGGGITLLTIAWADYFGRASLGTIRGITMIPQTASVAIGPLFAGIVYDSWGTYVPAFYLFCASTILAGIWMLIATVPTYPGSTTDQKSTL